MPRLKKDETGVVVYPSKFTRSNLADEVSPRDKRQGRRKVKMILAEASSSYEDIKLEDEDEMSSDAIETTSMHVDDPRDVTSLSFDQKFVDSETQTEECVGCKCLSTKNKRLRSSLKTAMFKLKKERFAQETDQDDTNENCPEPCQEPHDEVMQLSDNDMDTDDEYMMEEDDSMDLSDDSDDDIGEDGEDEIFHSVNREDITDNIRQQPKFVVFLTQLLLLFKTCFFCRHESEPSLKVSQVGTMVTITASCQNPKCKKDFVWKSQQLMPGSKIYAGNFLLSFAILVAGSSARKILQVMKHMGLACISLSTYFRNQRRNEAGSGPAMEYLAFQNCMGFLSGCQLVMSTFVSDRHGSISKHMKTKLANLKHYFDLWHLKKSKWCTKKMNRWYTNIMG
ncbi:Hypothetical predicted protein [Paramuricea clavata]|uniref:Uncharacterized protein n=1 Tax=Paramuricea clavata TaxID=317549 RepID=A0A7D9HR40_PARCT|nr:Hypothetical predicted protein [Paramuricea clavata]